MDDWKRYKGVITVLLDNVNGQVYMSFDLWTARNLINFNGIVVYFIDEDARKRTFLFNLSRVKGSHTGENITEGVGVIISEFNF